MNHGRHSLLMMAGCGLMVVGIVVLPFLGVKLGGILPLLFVLACPLSMVAMMVFMGRGHDHSTQGGSGDAESHGAHCHVEAAPRAASEPCALPAPPAGE